MCGHHGKASLERILHACRLARSFTGDAESTDAVGKLFCTPDSFDKYTCFTGIFYWTTSGNIIVGYIGFPFDEHLRNATFAALFFTSGLFIVIAAGAL